MIFFIHIFSIICALKNENIKKLKRMRKINHWGKLLLRIITSFHMLLNVQFGNSKLDKIGMTAKLLSQKQTLKLFKLNKKAESKHYHLTVLWKAYNRADNHLSSRKLLVELGKVTSKHSKAELREITESLAAGTSFPIVFTKCLNLLRVL